MNAKKEFTDLLVKTQREGIKELLQHMDKEGFFKAACSTEYHLAYEGGLVVHSLNVYNTIKKLSDALNSGINDESLVIVALLHDLGKMGDFGKPNYVPNILKSGELSSSKPFKTNTELLSVPHEVRSVSIARRYIRLTEQEEFAILMHNGLYGSFKYELQGKETPLYLLLHDADMWACRVLEK